MEKRKFQVNFVETSVVHVYDKRPSGFSILLLLSFHPLWKLITCCLASLGSYYFFSLISFQVCGVRQQYLIQAWRFLSIIDIMQIIDMSLTLIGKVKHVHYSRRYPYWLLVLNILGSVPMYSVFPPPEDCKYSILYYIIAGFRQAQILSYLIVVFKSYRVNKLHITCVIIVLYILIIFVAVLTYAKCIKSYSLDFFNLSEDTSYSDLEYFARILVGIWEVFLPIKSNIYYIDYPTAATMVYVAVIGSLFVSLIVTLESIPAVFMVHYWRNIYMKRFRTGAACIAKKRANIETVFDRKTIEKKPRKDWIALQNINMLKDSVYLDLCLQWHYTALTHCSLFRDKEVTFLRALASSCVVKNFVEDEVVFAADELKDSLVFIEHGTLGFADPNESTVPVFFLDAGSLLGEVSLIRVYRNSLIVTCASDKVTLHILHRNAFLSVCNLFPRQYQEISKAVNERFIVALKFLFYARYVMIGHPAREVWKVPENRMVWVVSALNHMHKARLATPLGEEPEYLWDPTLWNSSFHSQMPEHLGRIPLYLSKLVPIPISNIFRRHSPPILKDGYLPMLYPKSLHAQLWEKVYVIVSCIFLICWPIRLLFGVRSPLSSFQYFFQFVFAIDFLIYFISAEKNFQGVLIQNFSELFAVKLFRKKMWIRFLCSIPIDFIMLTDLTISDVRKPSALSHIGMYQIPQLLCLIRVMEAKNVLKTKLIKNVLLFQFIENIIILLYFSYAIGTAMLVATCFKHTCDRGGWFYQQTNLTTIKGHKSIAISNCVTVGISAVLDINRTSNFKIRSEPNNDTILRNIFSSLGFAMKIYLYSSTLFSVITSQTHSYKWISSVERIKYYLYSKRVKWATMKRVEKFLQLKWKCNMMSIRENQSRDEVLRARFKIVSKHPIFRWMSKEQILDLLKKTQSSYFPPNEVVLYKGQMITGLYMIEKGNCMGIPSLAGGNRLKTKGALFGLPEMLLDKPSFQTVVTTSSALVMVLPFEYFYESIKEHPAIFQTLSTKLTSKFGMIKSLTTLQRADREFKLEVYLLRPTVPSFINVTVPPLESSLAKEYFQPFKLSNFGATFRFFLRNRVVNPNGKFYILWECFLCFVFACSVMLLPLRDIIRLISPVTFYAVFSFVLFLSIVDIYLKFHLAYFNENGSLVIHPVRTAENFIGNELILDFTSTLGVMFVLITNYFVYYIHILKLFRVFKLFRTVERHIGYKISSLAFVKYLLVLGIVANIVVVLYIKQNCDTGNPSFSQYMIQCNEHSGKPIYDKMVPVTYVFLHVSLTFQFQLQNFRMTQSIDWFEYKYWLHYIPISFFVLFSYLYYKSVVVSEQFADTALVYRHSVKIRRLQRFMVRHKIPKHIVRYCIVYFKKMWKIQLGLNHSELFKIFDHSPLGLDILYDIYGKTFAYSPIPNAATSVYKNLLKVSEFYIFLEKSIVMRKNDIVNNVYMVHSGYAYCYDENKRVIDVLTQGDMFGSVHAYEEMLPYTIIPQTKMQIIAITSNHFFGTLDLFDIVKKQFNHNLLLERQENKAGEKLEREIANMTKRRKMKLARKILAVIEKTRIIFSAVIYCYTILMIGLLEENIVAHIILYAFEGIRMLLLMFFHLAWKGEGNRNLNDRIDYTTIRRNRIDFYYDLLATSPYDLLYLIYWKKIEGLTFFILKMNRLFEIKVLYDYRKRRPYRSVTSTIIYDLFIVLLLFHSFFTALTFVKVTKTPEAMHQSLKNKMLAYLNQFCNCLTFLCNFDFWITNEWTTKDMIYVSEDHSMMTHLMFLIMIPTLFMGHMLFGMVSREFYKISRFFLSTCFKFSKVVDSVLYWTHSTECPLMTDYVKDYFDYLWYARHGEDFPSLLKTAPNFIKDPVSQSLYRGLLKRAVLFRGFSPDLVRQMCRHVVYNSYCPGDIVVRKDNANGIMYIVMKGRVHALEAGYIPNLDDTITYKEKIRCVLERGDMFGMKQGLTVTPYRLTYRCAVFSIVISLNYQHWHHLLAHFPKEKELLEERIIQLDREIPAYDPGCASQGL